ncbi:hypothetical protein [uncultured Helicobacter sp.]|uniref:hypothetical protein n=1 Tax=uncultured Helicobacter sp. TaxID=175537 RepID=UPI002613EBEF|nr:hypothetical protein [uncultured Helicobacter sp.]
MKKVLIAVSLVALLGNVGFAADSKDAAVEDVKNKAIDIGINAISGFLSGKKGDEIVKEAKDQAIDAAQDTANKKLNEAKR